MAAEIYQFPSGLPRNCSNCIYYLSSPSREVCDLFREEIYDAWVADDCDEYSEEQ